MEIADAIEVFGGAMAVIKSFTYPSEFLKVGPLWVFRDTPRKKPEYRCEEWITCGITAAEADMIIQPNRRERYAVCAVRSLEQSEEAFRADYKSEGYRLQTTELFFVHSLSSVQRTECNCNIERVTDQGTAERLKEECGSRQLLPEHLEEEPPRIRQYIAVDSGEIVGWVRSIVVGNAAWCSNMYVKQAHRRKGIGKALMSRMLFDDKASGLEANVLLASKAGSMLYPLLGYELIGQLFVYRKSRG